MFAGSGSETAGLLEGGRGVQGGGGEVGEGFFGEGVGVAIVRHQFLEAVSFFKRVLLGRAGHGSRFHGYIIYTCIHSYLPLIPHTNLQPYHFFSAPFTSPSCKVPRNSHRLSATLSHHAKSTISQPKVFQQIRAPTSMDTLPTSIYPSKPIATLLHPRRPRPPLTELLIHDPSTPPSIPYLAQKSLVSSPLNSSPSKLTLNPIPLPSYSVSPTSPKH